MSNYMECQERFINAACEKCSGLGEIDDAEPGDIGYNTWECPDCNGTGFGEMRMQFLFGIDVERTLQEMKWGGDETDDQYNAGDWHAMLADYTGWARRMWCMGSLEKARKRFLQVAALAVAAAEAIERRFDALRPLGPYDPRKRPDQSIIDRRRLNT